MRGLGTLVLLGGGAALLYVATRPQSLDQQVDASILASIANIQRAKLRAAGVPEAKIADILLTADYMRRAGRSAKEIDDVINEAVMLQQMSGNQ